MNHGRAAERNIRFWPYIASKKTWHTIYCMSDAGFWSLSVLLPWPC